MSGISHGRGEVVSAIRRSGPARLPASRAVRPAVTSTSPLSLPPTEVQLAPYAVPVAFVIVRLVLLYYNCTPLTTAIGKFAFGDRTIPIHARTLGVSVPPHAMGVYYGTVQSAVVHTN